VTDVATDIAADFDLGDLPRPVLGGLRPELELLPVDPDPDGSPAWVLVDPLAGRFYRLGALEVDLLHLVPLGAPSRIAEEATRRAGKAVSEDLVKEFIAFLLQQNLTRVVGDEGRARLERLRKQTGKWSLRQLTQGWMSVRLRLVRPDRFLEKALPVARWWFSRPALILTAIVGGLGLLLASRQMDAFFATFSFFFSFDGLVFYTLTLTALKVLHELGHAFACKLQGCRVPSMGVSFLVFWPVLYTDTTEAWKLPSRASRLKIGSAGMRAELMLACYALFLWSLLPDGVMRSVCFFVSTTAVLLTLTVNLNPLMKFDGYYLLSDWLQYPNLQPRTYALARWWLRANLLGWRQAPPEPPKAYLIGLGVAIWFYRLSVTLGIALLVYHFAFKAGGVLMALAVLWWSLVLPFAKEIKAIYQARHGFNRRSKVTLGVLLTLLILASVPLQGHTALPAFVGAESVSRIYATADGRIAEIDVANDQEIAAGQPIMRMDTPDLAYKLADAESEAEALRWQMSSQGFDRNLLDRAVVTAAELGTALSQRDSLRDQMTRAQPLAQSDGIVVDLPDNMQAGDWVGEGTYLASVAAAQPGDLVAYANEDQMRRIHPDAKGLLYLKGIGGAPIHVRVAVIETSGLRELDQAFMASTHGGPIAVRDMGEGKLVPVRALYRIRLKMEGDVGMIRHVSMGNVRIEATAESLLQSFWRQTFGLLRRELSF
jgi:putative peptide zinc metalloprotease protein